MEPIAIVGAGCRFAGGCSSPSQLWDLLQEPRDVATKVPSDRFNIDSFYHPIGSHHGTTNVKESYFISDDVKRFDASFFNISASEAECIDPQQRILLETVYDALQGAGIRMEDLKGSSTGVFCGVMCDDFSVIQMRDIGSLPRYASTGTARSIIANRVSYFFDWHGPSVAIDTACSSSLVAVDLAVKALRDGDCRVAVVCGTNLILAPNMYVSEANLNMLSPRGRSRMWDAGADGYARGEGIAVVVLKKLDHAVGDGDSIDCIIRATQVNQDGRTMGITMPSGLAQESLICSTYKKAGLDPIGRPQDRCQYFEAHGTGTAAGDPQEASAIYRSFFPKDKGNDNGSSKNSLDKLWVGSVKTIIGHTEGAAGLAGLIKASLCLQHGVIAPNLHFERAHPSVQPYTDRLHIPTRAQPWPSLPDGLPRRASVNSFGFGGTNAHVILESYLPSSKSMTNLQGKAAVMIPFVFSAPSEKALDSILVTFVELIAQNPPIDPVDMAWTLFRRRSVFPYRLSISASSLETLYTKLQEELAHRRSTNFVPRAPQPLITPVHILGVFTGQGAQWAQMGADLVTQSPGIRGWLSSLQESLDSLPKKYRPTYSLWKELSKPQESSQLHQAAISQPLCTAVQIILVKLLRSLGITFSAVVGHSSGEIAAAYAAGVLSESDAVRIAHLRGVFSSLAGANGKGGGMLASGLSADEAEMLCQHPEWLGRIKVAAVNSPSSVTLSGDADAIEQIEAHLKGQGKFARMLKVTTAYHSHHMLPCSGPYEQALEECKIQPEIPTSTSWFSSVYDGGEIQGRHLKEMRAVYWRENLANPVLFAKAVAAAMENLTPDVIIEVGPHPALKGPFLQTAPDLLEPCYVGLLHRFTSGVETVSTALGELFQRFGPDTLDIETYIREFESSERDFTVVKNLPSYPFDRSQIYSAESRYSKALSHQSGIPNPLLGTLTPDTTDNRFVWRNMLHPRDMPSLNGHVIQSQVVFPAAGYAALAIEASFIIAENRNIRLLELHDLRIKQAIVFGDESSPGVEVMFHFDRISTTDSRLDAKFACYANIGGRLQQCASGSLVAEFGEQSLHVLSPRQERPYSSMFEVQMDPFYQHLESLGYSYTGDFRSMVSVQRKIDISRGHIRTPRTFDQHPELIVHPAFLDTLLQTLLPASGVPEDGQLSMLMVPTCIKRIAVNPFFFGADSQSPGQDFPFDAHLTRLDEKGACGDTTLFDQEGNGMLQVEGLETSPLAPPAPADDRLLFSELIWGPLHPDASLVTSVANPRTVRRSQLSEQLALLYMQDVQSRLTAEDRANLSSTGVQMVSWIDSTLTEVRQGSHPVCRPHWLDRDLDEVVKELKDVASDVDLNLLKTVGENVLRSLRHETSISAELHQTGLLDRLYSESDDFSKQNYDYLAPLVQQITFRFPRMKILEIGGGTGLATQAILDRIGHAFHSYTFTDLSADYLEYAQRKLVAHEDRFIYHTLDINSNPMDQGFKPNSYDLVIAGSVFHLTANLQATLQHTRSLIKPGGYLVTVECLNPDLLRPSFIFSGLDRGWWPGEQDRSRPSGPTVNIMEWDSLLRSTGFSGVDTVASEDQDLLACQSVFVTQAVDDSINLLNQPLRATPPREAQLNDLIIIGRATGKTTGLVLTIQALIGSFFRHVIVLDRLDQVDRHKSWNMTTVLSLFELDHPTLCQDIQQHELECLKTVFNGVQNLLWVSAGSSAENPAQAVAQGWLRCLRYEITYARIQHLTVVHPECVTGPLVAETLLRLILPTFENQYDMPVTTWTMENELRWKAGRMECRRVIDNTGMNERYMSRRRGIVQHIDLESSICEVKVRKECYETFQYGSRCIYELGDPTYTRIKVSWSTLTALRIKQTGFLYLIAGREESTDIPVFALSRRLTSTVATPESWTIRQPEEQPEVEHQHFLATVAWVLLAVSLVNATAPGEYTWVHGGNRSVRDAIKRQALVRGVHPLFSTSRGEEALDADVTFIHPSSSLKDMQDNLGGNISCIARLDGHTDQISHYMRTFFPDAVVHDMADLHRASPVLQENYDIESVAHHFKQAYQLAQLTPKVTIDDDDSVISLPTLSGTRPRMEELRLLDWRDGSRVPVLTQPASFDVQLHANKTYLLIGMTGDLGRSVCEWMVSRGARHVVLTSRRPQVEENWLRMMSKNGARVVTISMDVTDKASILDVDARIRGDLNLPPLGGVLNGAMVLKDQVFSNMSWDAMQQVLRPKIRGSLLLDEVYFDAPLDFFILFGSISGSLGNTGQSAYAAANNFMSSIIQRRRARGQVGSIIHPGEIQGVGYVSRAPAAVMQALRRAAGSLALSERDIHEMLAEAILSGPPDSYRPTEIIGGLSHVSPPEQPDIIWTNTPIAWHHINHFKHASTGGPLTSGSVDVKSQIESITSMDDAVEVIEPAFVTKVRRKLQVPVDEALPRDSMLVDLGFDSLMAVDLRTWFIKEIGVDVPVLQLLSGSSIAQIVQEASARLVEKLGLGQQDVSSSPIPDLSSVEPESTSSESSSSNNRDSEHTGSDITPPSSKEDLESTSSPKFEKVERLSFSQARYWFLNSLMDDKTTHNVTMLFNLDQAPRVNDNIAAVKRLGMRHEALRTCFLPGGIDGDSDPCQAIMPTSRFQLEVRHVDNADAIRDEYHRVRDHVYDLVHGDVAQICLVLAPNNVQALIIGYHHICLDAHGFFVLLEELEMAYRHQPLPPNPPQYPEVAAAQRTAYETGAFASDLEYWGREFTSVPDIMPLLPMCRVQSRPVLKQYAMETVQHRVPVSLTAQVKSICRRNRTTPFNFYMAVLWVLLARATETNNVCIGFVDSGRADAASLRTVGLLLNTLPIRLNVDNNASSQPFRQILQLMDGKTQLARTHSSIPYDILLTELGVSRSTAHNPIFQVLMDWQPQTTDEYMIDGIRAVRQDWEASKTSYDLTLHVGGSEDGSTVLDFRLQEALFSRRGAELVAQSYLNLMHLFASDDDFDAMKAPLYPTLEVKSSINIGRGPSLPLQWASTLSRHIDQVATTSPTQIAVQDAGGSTGLTYHQLMVHANVIAGALRGMGVGPGSRVCLFQHPTANWVSCMLAIWRLDATYVPLDLRVPLPRLELIIQSCQPQAIVYHDDTEADVHQLSCSNILNISRLHYNDTAVPILPNESASETCCAILHSSGSTGKPKGIRLTHSGLRNVVEGDVSQFKLRKETVLQQSALTFDFSLIQVLVGLVTGGTVIVMPRSLRGDPMELAKAIVEGNVTYTGATPSEYATWLSYGGQTLKNATSWRAACAGGEFLTPSLGLEFRRLGLPDLHLFNIYGPSETTLASHKTEIHYQDSETLLSTGQVYPVGNALPNYITYIVDKQMKPVPQGVSGEVLIGGAGVAQGYLHLETLTKERFIPNVYATQEDIDRGWTHLYRTSDRGRLLFDGKLVIEGRLDGDTQVKLRGIRLDLQDIEHEIRQLSEGALIRVIVSLRGEREDAFLAAHVEFAPNYYGNRESLLERIRASLTLPQYMWPAVIVPVERMPLNIHGKVDRLAMNTQSITVPRRPGEDSPTTPSLTFAEEILRDAWAKVLPNTVDLAAISRNTDFFVVGGNSLFLIKLQAIIIQDMGARVPLAELIEANRLGDMAQKIAHYQAVAPVDWHADTSVDDLLENNSLLEAQPGSNSLEASSDLTVILTGATGFLGSKILQALVMNPAVSRIHAIAVRRAPGDEDRVLATTSSKVTIHYGDLAAPLLGLGPETYSTLADSTDRIIHCGANRSFWDAYSALRGANVHSTKTLISLAQRRQVPIHFISNSEVVTIPEHETPASDGAGYLASKWASERLLVNARDQLGVPVCIHRPVEAENMVPPPPSLTKELQELIFKLESVPTVGGMKGNFSLMPVDKISKAVVAAVLGKQESKMLVQEHIAEVRVRIEDVMELSAPLDQHDIAGFARIPAPHWIGRAKKEGQLSWWIARQDAELEGEGPDGRRLSTRR
ncbi:Nonribosomal peptide synthetase 14 [Talaromyces islandicus]|uniref:Nonribosomal peptide synthetase 14 n=1 Tax=Talaromyces islandicus TaxID=28573 RepID=A0A0U1LV83_TALIS|nr:Nonribosomal peptide synthetase 14 [Talaromyces islandicus]